MKTYIVLSTLFAIFTSTVYAIYIEKPTTSLAKRGPPNGLSGIQTSCTKDDCVSLTFDDGPWIYMRDIVDIADEAGIKVTFFINANNYDCIYNENRVADLKYAFSHGHQFCSHTTSHADLNTLNLDQIKTQMKDLNDALWKILGIRTNCMRPPLGNANDDVVDYLNNELGYVVITWNFDTLDSDGASLQESKQIIDKIQFGDQPIVLMHETEKTSAHSLFRYTIKHLMENGYSKENFYTIPDGLGFNGYRKRQDPEKRDDSWTCDNMPPPGSN